MRLLPAGHSRGKKAARTHRLRKMVAAQSGEALTATALGVTINHIAYGEISMLTRDDSLAAGGERRLLTLLDIALGAVAAPSVIDDSFDPVDDVVLFIENATSVVADGFDPPPPPGLASVVDDVIEPQVTR